MRAKNEILEDYEKKSRATGDLLQAGLLLEVLLDIRRVLARK